MKSFFFFVVMMLVTSAAATSFVLSSEPQVEVEYLDTHVAGVADITEVFSFNCPHCRTFSEEFRVSGALKKLAHERDISYEKYHVEWGSSGRALSEAWAVAVTLGLEEEISEALFSAVQDKRKIKTQEDIYTFFREYNISQERYSDTLSETRTQSFIARQRRAIEGLQVNSVPGVYISGVMKVKNEVIDRGNGKKEGYASEYVNAVLRLLKLESPSN